MKYLEHPSTAKRRLTQPSRVQKIMLKKKKFGAIYADAESSVKALETFNIGHTNINKIFELQIVDPQEKLCVTYQCT